jgi:hypothetical protein
VVGEEDDLAALLGFTVAASDDLGRLDHFAPRS